MTARITQRIYGARETTAFPGVGDLNPVQVPTEQKMVLSRIAIEEHGAVSASERGPAHQRGSAIALVYPIGYEGMV